MNLVSRISNSFQGPLLGKRIEENLISGNLNNIESDSRLIILAASIATVVGAFATPSFQRLLTSTVHRLKEYQSILKLAIRGMSKSGFVHIMNLVAIPKKVSFAALLNNKDRVPTKILLLDIVATAAWTVGVLSSLYAGYLEPDLRVTASQLSSIINGVAVILLYILIDPYVAMMIDNVANGDKSQAYFRC